ncbi:MAG: SRPBCC domain-containing protein [Specibacter sp.]
MANSATRDIIITRILNAPVETLWTLWTDPAAVTQWWGPEDYTSPSARIDLREGGSYLFSMQAPTEQGGLVSYTGGTYAKIAPMQRLEFTQNLTDEDGELLPAEALPEGFSQNVYTIVEFKDVNGLTELTITEKGWTRSLMSVFSYAGMHQSLDKMAACLAQSVDSSTTAK